MFHSLRKKFFTPPHFVQCLTKNVYYDYVGIYYYYSRNDQSTYIMENKKNSGPNFRSLVFSRSSYTEKKKIERQARQFTLVESDGRKKTC